MVATHGWNKLITHDKRSEKREHREKSIGNGIMICCKQELLFYCWHEVPKREYKEVESGRGRGQ